MTGGSLFVRSRLFPLIIAASLAAVTGCRPPAAGAGKAPPPAAVENPVKEGDLATVRLTAEAVTRLGIETAPAERKDLPRSRTVGGEAMAAPGAAVALVAPLAGTVRAVSTAPVPGAAVKTGETLLILEPLLSPETRASLLASRTEAEGALEGARAQSEAAKLALERAERLLGDKAGSRRAVEEARAHLEVTGAALRAAAARRDLHAGLLEGKGEGSPAAVPIPSPLDGQVRKVHAVPGQMVAAGAPLLDVLDTGRSWVRAPVYVGDLAEIDAGGEVRIGIPGDPPGAPSAAGRPVPAPPAADPAGSTVDLLYEVARGGPRLVPGQRVAVRLPLRGRGDGIVVPWSAVVHDSGGGTWVYERTAPGVFVRRRVGVRFVEGSLASLETGPKPGAEVVVAGAAELFGTEFGIGK